MPLVARSVPNASYTIIGDGSDLVSLKSLARRMGVAERVQFAGRVDDDALFRAYRECDVFALPSAKEGFGLVFIEAMAARKPVVAARAGGTGEVVLDGETGALVDYANVRELADQLIALLNDGERRRRMGAAGRCRVEERFTFKRYVERVAELMAIEN
jgi:glycosyltransferase involved in cell wall biosynthesis